MHGPLNVKFRKLLKNTRHGITEDRTPKRCCI